jgi:hypothetical protein
MLDAKLCRLSVLIVLAGCTTQHSKVGNNAPDIQCQSEARLGSLVPKSVCTTRDQRERMEWQRIALNRP